MTLNTVNVCGTGGNNKKISWFQKIYWPTQNSEEQNVANTRTNIFNCSSTYFQNKRIWLSLSFVPWIPGYKWIFIFLQKGTSQSLETRVHMTNLTRSHLFLSRLSFIDFLYVNVHIHHLLLDYCHFQWKKNLQIKRISEILY